MLYNPKWEANQEAKTVERWRAMALTAAAIIQERGLAKGCLEDRSGGLCLIGALCVACSEKFGPLKDSLPALPVNAE